MNCTVRGDRDHRVQLTLLRFAPREPLSLSVETLCASLLILLTSLTVFAIGTLTTLLIQRYIAGDDWGPAAAKGMVMGVVAGIPFLVTGTAAGISRLGWAGLHRWIKPNIG